MIDDPELDATDFAHPAWWRGARYGSYAALRRVADALDGKDDGSGVLGDPEMERCRRMILLAQRICRRLSRKRSGAPNRSVACLGGSSVGGPSADLDKLVDEWEALNER